MTVDIQTHDIVDMGQTSFNYDKMFFYIRTWDLAIQLVYINMTPQKHRKNYPFVAMA